MYVINLCVIISVTQLQTLCLSMTNSMIQMDKMQQSRRAMVRQMTETATDEKTTERSDDQVITGNKTDSKENATDNETEDDDAGEHDAGEQGNITVTREYDEHQHTSNEGDEEHVQWSRMTSMHHNEGRTEGRYDKEFMCYLCCEKFYNKSGVRTHYLHAHNMSLDV